MDDDHTAWLAYLEANRSCWMTEQRPLGVRVEHLSTRTVSLAPNRDIALSALAEMLAEQVGPPPL